MSAAGEVTLRGAANLRRTLARAAAALQSLRHAHGAAGAVVVPTARARAPRRTGRLMGSLTADAGAGYVNLTSNLPYARVIHYGSRRRHITPQPFITDAVEQRHAAVLGTYEAGVESILRTVKGI